MATYSRSIRRFDVSLLSVMPLLAVYIVGAFLMHRAPPNGADVLTPLLWRLFGTEGVVLFGLFFLLLAFILYARLSKEGRFSITYIFLLLGEGILYAFTMVIFIWLLLNLLRPISTSAPAPTDFSAILVVSSGAGVWEELLFRVTILGGIYNLFARRKGGGSFFAYLVALTVSSFLFSITHFLTEPPTAGAFWYRFFAALFLGMLYTARGYGVCAYCHFTYDVAVLCLR